MKNLFQRKNAAKVDKAPDNTLRPQKVRRIYSVYAATVLTVALCSTSALAAGDPLAVINNLSEFIFSLIKAVGGILVGWGIVQVGLSIQSHDPSQRSQGFLTLAGGVVVFFAKEILTLISG